MSANPNTPESIIAQAQALIEQVQGQLEAYEGVLRSQGLDPEKVRATLQAELTPGGKAQAERAFASDMTAVEQETREEAARVAFTNPAPAGNAVRRRRPMV